MGKRILIVEDDRHIAELIAFNLEANGYEVLTANDGRQGLQRFLEDQPDLAILDIMMPGLDGIGLLGRIRSEESVARTPVIMLTARGSEMDKVIGLEVGADDYMTKPFSIHELVARVKAHLRRSERERADVPEPAPGRLIHGKLSMDPERHEVLMDGEPVELSLKEFELLRVLMENRGRVLTRDRLLDEVWGYDYYGETRTVDVHIRHLRRKLNADGDALIHTVRGVGYQIRQEAE